MDCYAEAYVKFESSPAGVSVTLLGDGVETPISASVLSLSGRRMTLAIDVEAPPVGATIKVQSPEYLVLAEVSGVQDSHRTLILQIRHVLRRSDMERIAQRWT